MQYRKLISILLLMGVMSLSAQELAVKSFTLQENDLTARTLPRKDINGTECALVKVQIVGQGVTFSGSVMGEVAYKGNEYWVYMPNGTKRLKVTHPDCLPMEIEFEKYGIAKVQSKMTYLLAVIKKTPPPVTVERTSSREVMEKKLPDGYVNILSDRRLLPSDLNGKSRKELEIYRNMIYAKYGYRFKRDDLFRYFSQFTWYRPTTSDAAVAYGRMSQIERYNIDFIKKYER